MSVVECNTVTPIHDGVFVTDMNFEEQTTATGIVIISDDGKSEGIKPRWGKVYAIGKDQHDVKVGDWILIEHGRWTRSIKLKDANREVTVRRVETKSIMMTSEKRPLDVYLGVSNKSPTQDFDFSQPMF